MSVLLLSAAKVSSASAYIDAASAIESVSSGTPYEMQIYILLALLVFVLPIMPYLLKYTLSLSINN